MYCLSSVGILAPLYCSMPDKWFSVGESVHSSWRSLETWRESKSAPELACQSGQLARTWPGSESPWCLCEMTEWEKERDACSSLL